MEEAATAIDASNIDALQLELSGGTLRWFCSCRVSRAFPQFPNRRLFSAAAAFARLNEAARLAAPVPTGLITILNEPALTNQTSCVYFAL